MVNKQTSRPVAQRPQQGGAQRQVGPPRRASTVPA
jgi:hypothetical protein